VLPKLKDKARADEKETGDEGEPGCGPTGTLKRHKADRGCPPAIGDRKYTRPRGRAPKGKKWNDATGEFENEEEDIGQLSKRPRDEE